MHHRLILRVYLTLAVTLVLSTSSSATSLLKATCGSVQGSEMQYGGGLLELMKDEDIQIFPAQYDEVQPIFLVEGEAPQTMTVLWGYPTPLREFSHEHYRVYTATIVLHTALQITAIHRHGEGVWMYSLLPKLGIGYFSAHSHFPMGSASRNVSVYAICHFTRTDQ